MKKYMYMLFFSNCFLSGYVSAWNGPHAVGTLEMGNAGLFISKVDGSDYSGTNCSSKNWVSLTGTPENIDRMLSVVIAAQTTGKKLKYLVVGCDKGGTNGNIEATRVLLDPNW